MKNQNEKYWKFPGINDLNNLIVSNNIKIPIYDYKTHTRRKKNSLLKITPVIIIEGIFKINS